MTEFPCDVTDIPHLFGSALRGGVAPLLLEDLPEDLQVCRDDGAVASVGRPGVAAAAPRAGDRRRRRGARRLWILQEVSFADTSDSADGRRGG